MDSILELLEKRATSVPESAAILDEHGAMRTWRDVHQCAVNAGAVLRAAGVMRGDRVAAALPNGTDAALWFLATTAWATAAPLNPVYGAAELEFYLGDLKPRAIVLPERTTQPAAAVAEKMGIAILTTDELLRGDSAAAPSDPAAGDDVALVLHTSGTTSRPKLVPLTQRNLLTSARNIASTLALTPADRALNVMPLFHIHGLLGVLLSSTLAGGSVACLPRFEPEAFFDALEALQPTWYSAVPTIHQSVLEHSQKRSAVHRLRFIRSSSSALPPQVMAGLEEAFGVPVVEAYGMTEASHQMASNPLPPAPRKPASVGLPAGPEIAILDADGNELARGEHGEISIRGANVTAGYVENADANAKSFTRGWFRTGDEGYFDDDGYLFLTGRLKEMINRGGEKIAPVEIDRVLLDHPAVAQAVAFAVPHPRLGEDVGVAIVLRSGAQASAGELRAFARSRLAAFKVPSVVRIVDAIPKGATGKQQRIGLAEKLGVTGESAAEGPRPASPMEQRIAGLWAELLRVDDPRLTDDFFQSGGDSIVSVQLLARIRQRFGVELALERFFDTPTLGDLAAMTEAQLVEKLTAMSEDEAAAMLREIGG